MSLPSLDLFRFSSAQKEKKKAENQKGKQNTFLQTHVISLKESQVFIIVIRVGELEGTNLKTKIKSETLTMGWLAEQKSRGEDFFMA